MHRKKRRSRAQRVIERTHSAQRPSQPVRRRLPVIELLDEDALDQLEHHADWLLKEIGIEFRGDEEALALFSEAGATVCGERVRFDSGHAKFLCATAPSTFTLHA